MSTRRTSIYVDPTGGARYCTGPISPLMMNTAEGPQMIVGYMVINTIPAGVGGDFERMIVEAAPGVPPLAGMGVAVSGLAGEWDDATEGAHWPDSLPYLRRCTYLDTAGEPVSCWEHEVPEGAEVIDGPVLAHGWA
jgi:hypothetical protein